MKIGVLVPPLPLPVQGYGGIEKEAIWLADAMVRRGHEVTVYGNLTDKTWRPTFNVRSLPAENLIGQCVPPLSQEDVVWDWTHTKEARIYRFKGYIATTMWTDLRGCWGRDIYPSEAVRTAFKDSSGQVIPLGLPTDEWQLQDPDPNPYYLAPLRMNQIKGVDHAINLWRTLVPKGGPRLIVAGHASAPFADPHFALRMRKVAHDAGAEFIGTPSSEQLGQLMARATGVLHPHRWIESFSLAAAEALCRGVPVLTTDVGGTQEIVRGTGGGAVTSLKNLEEGNPDTAAQAFFTKDWTDRRKAIARRARSLLDLTTIANRYDGLMEDT